jgi:hypothetical protein
MSTPAMRLWTLLVAVDDLTCLLGVASESPWLVLTVVEGENARRSTDKNTR